jgi:catechol 2,3-dioxygenase-like lactoylglutathione lyase family enzyme
MKLRSFVWLGTRTDRYREMIDFLQNTLGFTIDHSDDKVTALTLPNGDRFEVFSPDEPDHSYFTTGPVVGFAVDDVDAARKELQAADVELIGGVESEGDYLWQHFRAPDGNVYEITGKR